MAEEVVSLGIGLDTQSILDEFKRTTPKIEAEVNKLNQKMVRSAQAAGNATGQTFAKLAQNSRRTLSLMGEGTQKFSSALGGLNTNLGKTANALSGLVALGPALLSPWTLLIAGIAAATGAIISHVNETNKKLQEQADATREARGEWEDFYKSVVSGQTEAAKKLEGFDKAFQEDVIGPMVAAREVLSGRILAIENMLAEDLHKIQRANYESTLADLKAQEKAKTEAILSEIRRRNVQVQDVTFLQGGGVQPGTTATDPLANLRAQGAKQREAEAERLRQEAKARQLRFLQDDARERHRLVEETSDKIERANKEHHDRILKGKQEFYALLREQAAESAENSRNDMATELALQYDAQQQADKAEEERMTRIIGRAEWFKGQVQAVMDFFTLTGPIELFAQTLGNAFASAIASTEDFGEAFKRAVGAIMIQLGAQLVVAGTVASILGGLATIFPLLGVAFGIAPGAGPMVALLGAGAIVAGVGLIAGGVALGGRGSGPASNAKGPTMSGGGGGSASGSGFSGPGDVNIGGEGRVINLYVNRPMATSGAIARDVEELTGGGYDVRIGGD